MTVTINRQPIDGVAIFILAIGITLVVLHVNGVVHRLGETASDRLCDAENAIQSVRAKERIVNEIVPHPVDVRIHH